MDDVNSRDMSRYKVIENWKEKLATKSLFSCNLRLEDLIFMKNSNFLLGFLFNFERFINNSDTDWGELYDEVIRSSLCIILSYRSHLTRSIEFINTDGLSVSPSRSECQNKPPVHLPPSLPPSLSLSLSLSLVNYKVWTSSYLSSLFSWTQIIWQFWTTLGSVCTD